MDIDGAALKVVAERVGALLYEHGPMSEDELITAGAVSGVDVGADPGAVIEHAYAWSMPLVQLLDDDLYCRTDMILAGRTFTHRLTQAEISGDCLELDADLQGALIVAEHERYQQLGDGRVFRRVTPNDDGEVLADRNMAPTPAYRSLVLLDRGTLVGDQAGDLLGVHIAEDGFTLQRVAETDLEEAPTQLRDAVLGFVDEHEAMPDMLWEIVVRLCIDDPHLFRTPLRPFGELLNDYGVEVHDDAISRSGYDFAATRRLFALPALAAGYGLTATEATAIDAFDRLRWALTATDGPNGDEVEIDAARDWAVAQLGEIRSPAACGALNARIVEAGPEWARAHLTATQMVAEQAPPAALLVLRWVSGKAYENLGQSLDAERSYNEALAVDAHWGPAAVSLAGYALDRGDCQRALDLLDSARAPYDDPLRLEAERYTPRARTSLGRNKPCWCGSGRKYKMCHLGKETAPIAERAGWLYDKALRFLVDDNVSELLLLELEQRWQDIAPESFRLVGQEAVADIALAEGDRFTRFLAQRSVLLPEDEQELATRWAGTPRSIFDVESAAPGCGWTLRDLRTGERHLVPWEDSGAQVQTGDLLTGRPLPAGETTEFPGGLIRVPLHARDALLQLLDNDPQPQEVVDFLAELCTPPQMTTRDGQDMELCEARLQVPPTLAAARVQAVLDEAFSPGPETGWVWLRTDEDGHHVDGAIAFAHGELMVEALSVVRLDALLAVLTELLPGTQVLSRTHIPVDLDALRSHDMGPDSDREQAPGAQDAMAQHIHEYEQRWLDMEIPALGGLTPRQAAADPTRREDLHQLLAGIPVHPGGMSADRLRTTLGL
jgi:tetratricopeptide (TPR) repeat protein